MSRVGVAKVLVLPGGPPEHACQRLGASDPSGFGEASSGHACFQGGSLLNPWDLRPGDPPLRGPAFPPGSKHSLAWGGFPSLTACKRWRKGEKAKGRPGGKVALSAQETEEVMTKVP